MNEKNQFPSEKIYEMGLEIGACLCVYDLIPPFSHEAEKFVEFLRTIDYCTKHKMYNVRDNAIRLLINHLYE